MLVLWRLSEKNLHEFGMPIIQPVSWLCQEPPGELLKLNPHNLEEEPRILPYFNILISNMDAISRLRSYNRSFSFTLKKSPNFPTPTHTSPARPAATRACHRIMANRSRTGNASEKGVGMSELLRVQLRFPHTHAYITGTPIAKPAATRACHRLWRHPGSMRGPAPGSRRESKVWS